MITLGEVLKICTESLVEVSDSPNLDCQTLLADRLGQSRAWILAHPDINLTQSDCKSFQDDIEQLKMGVPLPYVLGHWEFYGLDFSLTRDTLIPRPETELLVEFAVDWLD
ncbi:MAG: protein-(glutamine-N5) methyltransferase, release factor-specific, partial [Chloroflexota bacterium]